MSPRKSAKAEALRLPVLPLREFVVFPLMTLPVFVTRERSIAALEEAFDADRRIALVAQLDGEVEEPTKSDLAAIGCEGLIVRLQTLPDGRMKALVQGLARVRIDNVECDDDLILVSASRCSEAEEAAGDPLVKALMRNVAERAQEVLPMKRLPPEIASIFANVEQPGRMADLVAAHLMLKQADAQQVLGELDPIARLKLVDRFLEREIGIMRIQAELNAHVQEEIGQGQRERFLREQMRVIKEELGEDDDHQEEIEAFREKLEGMALPEEAREETFHQLRRLERMHPDSPESQVVRTYLDWMVSIPWSISSPESIDIPAARSILDADHAYLNQAKERVLEHLGVSRLCGGFRGPILCFLGPPGVGKTSLGRSIARAMGRTFARISLGGLHDESEIRGHRRTYVGAMPGRIIQALRRSGTNNPVMMLDELDKLGNDFRGDPASALLEVLDPEQNQFFSDHYLNVAFDLSKVLFIATANQLGSIPAPLRDRMEIISLSGYTPEEKICIAEKHLIPRQCEEHGLTADRIQWSSKSIQKLITSYTAEPGVRGLERKIAKICRVVALEHAEGKGRRLRLTAGNLSRYLGSPHFLSGQYSKSDEVGVANGLAWTERGGEMLWLEVTLTEGKGLVLTGQLGEVMKESAQAAFTFARAWMAGQGRRWIDLEDHQVHVHVPAGAIPKDGPSAGVTMATALISVATGLFVRSECAMTGEVTLRGKVLPVGGIREKVLAAHRAGIRRVILPEENASDLENLPREIQKQISFCLVTHMDQVLEEALVSKKSRRRASTRPPSSHGVREVDGTTSSPVRP